jgi:hypothetical protein
MKRIITSLITYAFFLVLSAQHSFNTGSAEFDADLYTINIQANRDLATFKTNMTVAYNIEAATIDNMLKMGMEPAEVYLSLEIENISHSTLNNVVTSYRLNKEKGWGAIAKEMGIWPDSNEFISLKSKCKSQKDKGNG